MRKYYIFVLTVFLLTGCANKSRSLSADNSYITESDNSGYVTESDNSGYVARSAGNGYITRAYDSSKATTSPTHKAYSINGKRYYPKKSVPVGWKQRGIASWYGPDFHGRYTSSGELYDMNAYTAAHKTLPMGTIVKITNLENNKSVAVRVNDRGPFVKGRIIDLSYIAGKKIGLDKSGVAPAMLEVIGFEDKNYVNRYNTQTDKKNKLNKSEVTLELFETINSNNKNYVDRYAIQVGSFLRAKGAILTADKYKKLGYNPKILKKGDFYKVVIGKFTSYDEAKRFKLENNLNGFVVGE